MKIRILNSLDDDWSALYFNNELYVEGSYEDIINAVIKAFAVADWDVKSVYEDFDKFDRGLAPSTYPEYLP